MKRHTKLTSQQQEQQNSAQQQTGEQSVREFASVDAMLRHDALHTPVPPAIAFRLRDSVGRESHPARSWWRRLFGS
jgi:hypothetical protein